MLAEKARKNFMISQIYMLNFVDLVKGTKPDVV